MMSAEAGRRLKNRAASASAKPIAAAPSAGSSRRDLMQGVVREPAAEAESNARASGSRRAGRSLGWAGFRLDLSDGAPRRAIPSALPLGDIRSASYGSLFVLVLDRRGQRIKDEDALVGVSRLPTAYRPGRIRSRWFTDEDAPTAAQIWKSSLSGVPYDIEVDVEISVGNAIAHPSHAAPRNLGIVATNSPCLSMILAAASPMMARLITTACWVRLSARKSSLLIPSMKRCASFAAVSI